MNYELAKQLKDAGFPQDAENTRCRCSFPEEVSEPRTETYYGHDTVYVPTLEELIEACGLPFLKLIRDSQTSWDAHAYIGSSVIFENGNTPTEAVAKLWLALNKKA